MANAYLEKQKKERLALLDIGETVGRQQVTDMMASILSDYSIMGNKKLRPQEIARVIEESGKRLSYFWDAWCKSDKADFRQEELDRLLKEAVPGELFSPFRERYPDLMNQDYRSGKWK